MSGFEPLDPPRYDYMDVLPKAEKRALGAVEAYIDALKKHIEIQEDRFDHMALLVLELCKRIRETEAEDFILLEQIDKIERAIRKM